MPENSVLTGTIGIPDTLDIALPAFVYGFLQPRELAYGLIAEYVSSYVEDDVAGVVYLRDGLPLLSLGGNSEVHGFVLKSSGPLGMYKAIGDFEPRKQYRWETVNTIGSQHMVNTLVGRSPRKGATRLDHAFHSSDDNVLKFGPIAVERALRRAQVKGNLEPELMFSFDIQMAYLLIWSILERFMALRYGPSLEPNAKLKRLADDNSWQLAIQAVPNPPRTDRVFSSLDPEKSYSFDPAKPHRTLDYFYQFRSNLVHRGKAAMVDAVRLQDASRVLMECMRSIWLANGLEWLVRVDDC